MAHITFISNTVADRVRPYSKVLASYKHRVKYLQFHSIAELDKVFARRVTDKIVVIQVTKDISPTGLLAMLRSVDWPQDTYFILIGEKFGPATQIDKKIFINHDHKGSSLISFISLIELITTGRFDLSDATDGVERIIRSIEFPPEYQQSGITILTYFATLLRHKHLAENVKVSIEQDGIVVRLVIESSSGQRELIERTLETYALVITGKSSVDELDLGLLEQMELKSQLRIAYLQLQNQRDLIEFSKSEIKSLTTSLAETRESLVRGEQRAESENAQFLLLLETLVAHSTDLSRSMRHLAEAAIGLQQTTIADAIESLRGLIERGLQETDKEQFIHKIQIIRAEDPGLFDTLYEILLRGAVAGAAGNFLYSWLQSFINSLPK